MRDLPDRFADALRGRYRIERELGRGGMGAVYLAEDLKHHRKVAVKVLRPDLAASLGAERFLREIEVAARLQHPAILPLHDSGEAAGAIYYIMPYVEGESLRDRLARDGELPVEEAVRILADVLDALAYAHDKGVIHRDIKPDNIMLSGRHALLLDFGVAKAVSASTIGSFVTITGMAIGTPSYMAPEQAVAEKDVDPRADLYAVGVVAYEMLAGRRPFTGTTAQAIVAAQMTEAPEDLGGIRPALPEALAQLIMRALERRPADRWQSAADMLARLEPYRGTSGERPGASALRGLPRSAFIAAGIVMLFAVGAAGAYLVRDRGPDDMRLGRRVPLTHEPGLEIEPALSPDGRFVAYAAGLMQSLEIRVRQLDGDSPELVVAAQSERPQRWPEWSPDGGRILFASPRGIEIVSALGGTSRVVVPSVPDTAADAWGTLGLLMPAGWAPDGTAIGFIRGDTLYLQPLAGGPPRMLAHAVQMHSVSWSPDGRWIACVLGNRQAQQPGFLFANRGAARLGVLPASGGEVVPITEDRWYNASPVWAADGRSLLFVSNRAGGVDLYQLRITDRGSAEGDPVRLTNGLRALSVSASRDGRHVVFADFEETSNIYTVPVPAGGPVSVREAEPLTRGSQVIESVDVSRDGTWLAFDSDRSGNPDIWRMRLPGGEPERLTTDEAEEYWPAWSPDGQMMAFHGFPGATRHLYTMTADGRDRRQITDGPDDERTPRWSADGRSLYYIHNGNEPDSELRVLHRAPDGGWSAPRTVYRGATYPPVPSPDSRRVAFMSAGAVMVARANGDSLRTVVPRPADGEPIPAYVDWSDDGREIYYLAVDAAERTSIWSVASSGGRPRVLVRFDDATREWHRYGFTARHGRLYFTVGDRQSDIWVAEVEPRP